MAASTLAVDTGLGAPLRLRHRPPTDAATTLTKIHEIASPFSGVVLGCRRARFDGVFRKLHAYVAELEGLTPYGCHIFRDGRRQPGGGWARKPQGRFGFAVSHDRERAFVAAFGEAVERYASMFHEDPGSLAATWRDVRTRAVDPRHYQQYDETEYARIPDCAPFREDAPMRWVPATRLGTDEVRLVPMQLVWILYNPLPGEPLLRMGGSSGWGAHNTVEEALGRAINERVEHDAFVVMWANRLVLPRVDLETVRDRRTRMFLDMLAEGGCKVDVIDATTDLGYPAFVGVGRGDGRRYPMLTVSLGGGLTAEEGILQAVEELTALYAFNSARLREDWKLPAEGTVRTLDDHLVYYWDPKRLASIDWLWSSDEVVAARDIRGHAPDRATPLARVETATRLLAAAGVPVHALDTTPSDIREAGFRTVKAVAPLCSVEFGDDLVGRAFPRLYEAPVLMGRRETPLTPKTLNRQVHPHN